MLLKSGPFWIMGLFFIFIFPGCKIWSRDETITDKEYAQMSEASFDTIEKVKNVFPRSPEDVQKRLSLLTARAEEDLEAILSDKDEDRTFENTARMFDGIGREVELAAGGIYVMKHIHPDKALRDACSDALLKWSEFAIDKLSTVPLYKAFKAYVDGNAKKEKLNDEQQRYLEETMKGLKRSGLHLPEEKLAKVKELKKELAGLSLKFSSNISDDKSQLLVDESGLEGVSPEFKEGLKKEGEKFVLRCDMPTNSEIMKHCSVQSTRRDYSRKLNNKAYPENEDLLKQIIKKKDELAKLLGYDCYASLDFENQMAENVSNVDSFLDELYQSVDEAADKEVGVVLKEGESLLRDGKLEPWDFKFARENYRKKNYNIDDRKIAEYFPLEQTLSGVFDIYQNFLGLEFKHLKPEGLWHEDVSMIEIRKKGSPLVDGYLFLDLHPRDGKYPHACHIGFISPLKAIGGRKDSPSLSIIVANFPKPTKDSPSLLKHYDVVTFFHEFGHAMHGLLGRTEMSSFAGSSVPRDFVEVPSQMFEEWMWDSDILKQISGHYKTGDPLPDELISKMRALKSLEYGGWFIRRQCFLSRLALAYYLEGADKDVEKIFRDLKTSMIKSIHVDPESHWYASFGHLTIYMAKYYCYMWSKVISQDFFANVCKKGLLDGNIGREVVEKVLSLGGSVHPAKMVKNLLGRESNSEALKQDILGNG